MADGTYLVTATTSSFPVTKWAILLVKIHPNGSIIWSRSVEGENENRVYGMIGTSDGGFLIAGEADNALTTLKDLLAIKFDSGANIEWVGIYTAAHDDMIYRVAES